MIPVYFHQTQLSHMPVYEWAFGDKLAHPETSHRAEKIFAALKGDSVFELREPEAIPLELLKQVHHEALITLYQTASRNLAPDQTLCPSVFPKRGFTKANPKSLDQAGYYCLDSGTPLASTTWDAACWSAACGHEAAQRIRSGSERMVYALSRPPGHHASRDLFGGYCYFNNAAIATQVLRQNGGRVAILDIDFHHGNGTQEIYYREPDVLFVSLHGDPREFYPYFSGFASEKGLGRGKGFTLNVPLPGGCDGQEYVKVLLREALAPIRKFNPDALVVSAGFDTYKEDPVGRFTLESADFFRIGEEIGRLDLPTVVVQEGGYWIDALGLNVSTFLRGLAGTP